MIRSSSAEWFRASDHIFSLTNYFHFHELAVCKIKKGKYLGELRGSEEKTVLRALELLIAIPSAVLDNYPFEQ